MVIRPHYDDVTKFVHGFCAINLGDKWGFIDKKDRCVVGTQYKEVLPFSEHRAAVKDNNNKWGYVDEQGATLINPQFSDAGSFSEDLAPAKSDDRWGFINEKENL